MNDELNENLSEIDDLALDRLVDGELSEAQRRELLMALERASGGWRRCAMAFLEAQCWKQELGAVRREADPQSPPATAPRGPARSRPLGTLMAMAACFLVALGLGAYFRGYWGGAGPAAGVPFAVNRQPSMQPLEQLVKNLRPIRPAPGPDAEPGAAPEGAPAWQMVTLPVGQGSDAAGPVRLPAVERDHFDADWLDHLSSPVPPEFLEALQESGHRVQQQREVMPMRMKDGRRLLVPVDQLDIRYVGNREYQ